MGKSRKWIWANCIWSRWSTFRVHGNLWIRDCSYTIKGDPEEYRHREWEGNSSRILRIHNMHQSTRTKNEIEAILDVFDFDSFVFVNQHITYSDRVTKALDSYVKNVHMK